MNAGTRISQFDWERPGDKSKSVAESHAAGCLVAMAYCRRPSRSADVQSYDADGRLMAQTIYQGSSDGAVVMETWLRN